MSLSPKNVLIISYLFPPLGGSGSLRPLMAAKHLSQYGWFPIVLTVKNPDWYYAEDSELLAQLPKNIKIFSAAMLRSAWVYRFLNPLRIKKVDQVIRRYLLHPDEQIGWLPFARAKARALMKDIPISALYSTSGPLTSHLVALHLKRRFKIPWIAEFRDEWFEDPALPMPTAMHKRLHFHLEKLIVTEADKIITLAPAFNELLMKHGVAKDKFTTVPKGINDDDIPMERTMKKENQQVFTVVYAGLIYDAFPPDRFLTAVNALIRDGKLPEQAIKIRFVGAIAINPALDPFGIVECTGFLKRSRALEEVWKADLLLLLLSRERGAGVIPGKIFEYMASGNQILALIPPEATVAEIITRTRTGTVVDFYNTDAIKSAVLELYGRWKRGTLKEEIDWGELEKYRQPSLFKEIAATLDGLVTDEAGR
jgi:glycosyltransferase involved in cell wall biosynthesis